MLVTAYMKGRIDCQSQWVERHEQIAADAVNEYRRHIDDQERSAHQDRQFLDTEQAKLKSILSKRSRHNAAGDRTCIEPHDSVRLLDDYNAIFEKRVQAGRQPDGPE